MNPDSVSRRQFIGAASAAVASTIAGCGASGGGSVPIPSTGPNSSRQELKSGAFHSIEPEPYKESFGNFVDIVRDAGADNTGKEDVTPIIKRVFADDTLIYFPPGTYKMNSGMRRVGNRDVGIIGMGATLKHGRVDAIKGFDVHEGEFEGAAQLFKIGIPDNPHQGKFLFGGFTLDWRGENEGMQILNHHTAGSSEIKNLRCVGIHSLGCQGPLRIDPYTPDAKALVKNVDMRYGGRSYQYTINTRDTYDGGPYAGRSWATSGITMHPRADGKLRIQRMLCGGWPDNGLYVTGGKPGKGVGTVEVVQCIAANSQASNIRIGGVNSVIDNCIVVTDKQFNKMYYEQRPIRLDDGECTLKNTRIIQKKPTGRSITVLHNIDKAVIKNIDITIYGRPTSALVISPETGSVSVSDMTIQTKGWNGGMNQLIRNGGGKLNNIFINGKRVT